MCTNKKCTNELGTNQGFGVYISKVAKMAIMLAQKSHFLVQSNEISTLQMFWP